MSIRFDCLACKKILVVHDRFEGKVVRCPTCNVEITVPKKIPLGDERRLGLESQREVTNGFHSMPSEVPDFPSESSPIESEAMNVNTEPTVSRALPQQRSRRSIRNERNDSENDVQWDITPMVDVAFLLLIFFMLTASFSIQKAIRTSTPQNEQPSTNAVQIQQSEKVDSLVVQVDEFNAYTVIVSDGETKEASSKQELIGILKELRIQFGEQLPRIVIQAHLDSMHGATVGCMDAAREAEFTNFQLIAVEGF